MVKEIAIDTTTTTTTRVIMMATAGGREGEGGEGGREEREGGKGCSGTAEVTTSQHAMDKHAHISDGQSEVLNVSIPLHPSKDILVNIINHLHLRCLQTMSQSLSPACHHKLKAIIGYQDIIITSMLKMGIFSRPQL